MQSTMRVNIHTKPQPCPLYESEKLYTSEEKTSFNGLRVPMDPQFKVSQFKVDVNEWSLDHTFGFDNQLHPVPTFLGNASALMFTWELEKKPNSAWRGRYSVWYHENLGHEQHTEQSAFYLFKQRKGGNTADELVIHDDVPRPGRHEKSWLRKELGRIKKFLKKASSDGQWNPPFGTEGLTVDWVV